MSLDFDRSGPSPACNLDEFELLTGAARDDMFMRTERRIRSLQALQAARIHRVSRSGSHFDDGHRTVKNWHRAVTNGSGSTSAQQVQIAQMLADLPEIAAAANAGDLGADQLRLLCNLYSNPRARDQLSGYWERELVNYGRTRVLSDFEKICRRWERNADPDGARQKHEVARVNRCAKRSVVGSGSEITIKGDALSGEVCWNVIKAQAEAEYLTDVEQRAAKHGDDAPDHPLARTHAQRMHDAFVAVCMQARAAAQTGTNETAPTDTATTETETDTEAETAPSEPANTQTAPDATETETFETEPDGPAEPANAAPASAANAEPASAANAERTSAANAELASAATAEPTCGGSAPAGGATTEPLVVIHTTGEFAIAALLEYFGFDPAKFLADADRMSKSQRLHFCETAGGAQIDPRTLAVALLSGQIQRITTDPKGHTINLGRKSRLFTGAARDAVLLNEDRCSNCGARHGGVQIDHLLSWEELGLTDQDNAGPCCGWCNREKHRLKISVRRDETGWHYYRADGTEIAPRYRPTGDPPNGP